MLYIGKRDDGSVCGIEKLDESLKKIADIIEEQINTVHNKYLDATIKNFLTAMHSVKSGSTRACITTWQTERLQQYMFTQTEWKSSQLEGFLRISKKKISSKAFQSL